jgi:hypothetical protein
LGILVTVRAAGFAGYGKKLDLGALRLRLPLCTALGAPLP